MAGLTATGFEIKTQPELEQEISDGLKNNVSPNLKTTSDTVTGQLVKLISERTAALWELGLAVYDSRYPNNAQGQSLANIASLTGTNRRGATSTRVLADVDLDAGTYPAGSLIASILDRPQDRFVNAEEITSPGGVVAGQIFDAESTGPIEAPASTLTVIAQPVAGWNGITNPAGETQLGANQETDEELRIRREQELARQGSSTAIAMVADISQLTGVLAVTVLHNDTDDVDANGLPPHSLEAIVLGPVPPTAADDTALAEQIAASKADGIEAFGTSSETVTDTEGNDTEIGYTRPTTLDIVVQVEINVDATTYAGDTAVEEAIEAYIDGLGPGEDVVYVQVLCAPLGVAGVIDVQAAGTDIAISGSPATTANISVGIREVARTDNADITVTVT